MSLLNNNPYRPAAPNNSGRDARCVRFQMNEIWISS